MRTLIRSISDIGLALADLVEEKFIGADTESYGKEFDDPMFALQLSTAKATYYFNFHDYGDGTPVLKAREVIAILAPVFADKNKIVFIHNAKFDLRRFAIDGLYPDAGIHCTQTCARMVYNQHFLYSLEACAKRAGLAKDDAVEAYIKEHKLYGKDSNGDKKKLFHLVPFPIMFEYGCNDTEVCRTIGMAQHEELKTLPIYWNDLELQKVCYSMEERGVTCRQEYAQKGLEYELSKKAEIERQLSELAGEPFRNGRIWLQNIFDKFGVKYSSNPKTGLPIFDKDALAAIDHPIADLIRQYRRHDKYASTYYSYYAPRAVIHPQINLASTDTMRFSYSEPNLQNVPKEEELDSEIPYQVRGCFAPREGACLVFIDFNQQEFRLLLDYAGESELIRRINEENLDVHQATSEEVGVTRKQAKNLNFGLLYGMGKEKLANTLKLAVHQASMVRAQYFSKLPKIQRIIRAVIERAEKVKFVKTWTGRKLHFPKSDFAYAAPNHLIQGGCADMIKMAMVPIDELLRNTKSGILIQVHDELVLEFYPEDFHLVDEVVKIMETTYTSFNGMKLTCGVEHSWVSWGKRDVVAGKPIPKETMCKAG